MATGSVGAQPLLDASGHQTDSVALQQRYNSCGLAAMAFAMETINAPAASEAQLADALRVRYQASQGEPPAAGYSLADLLWVAGQWDVTGTVRKGRITSLRTQPLPVILWVDRFTAPHFLVMTDRSAHGVTVYDPASGLHELVWSELEKRWLSREGLGVLLQVTVES